MKNYKNICFVSSAVLAAITYLYLVIMTANGTGEGLSFTTFALWGALAWVNCKTMMSDKANSTSYPIVPAIYGIGATTTAIVLLYKGQFSWTIIDTIVAIMFVACLLIWKVKGSDMWALVMSVTAGAVAIIPFIMLTWHAPEKSPIVPNLSFLAVNILSLIAAESWEIKFSLFPSTNVLLTVLLVLPWLLK